MFSLLTLVTALLVAAAAEAADTLVKAKLHARRNYGLCVGLSDGTYNRNIVLRNCNHESAIWVIRDNEGDTFIRHRNVCLNGAWCESGSLPRPSMLASLRFPAHLPRAQADLPP